MKSLFIVIILLCTAFTLEGQEVQFTSGGNSWNPDTLGNHRAVIIFNGTWSAARVNIPWRRRDANPQDKLIIVVDAQTDKRIVNVFQVNVNREYGEIIFEPASGKGTYYVYYLPNINEGRRNYPNHVYLKSGDTYSSFWLNKFNLNDLQPNASVREIQAIDEFNSFYPMEIIATASETNEIINQNKGSSFVIFPEQREYPIKMSDDLPYRWIEMGPQSTFRCEARKGEYYVFQLGIYALKNLHDLKVEFTPFTSHTGQNISVQNVTCFNTDGINYDARPIKKRVDVEIGKVQAMWCGIDVPQGIEAGVYEGKAVVSAEGTERKEIEIVLTVTGEIVVNRGVDEPWKQTRLHWLNSTLGHVGEVIPPYISLIPAGRDITLLGRRFCLGEDGLPKQIESYFKEEMTGYQQEQKNILTAPISFIAEKNDGIIKWRNESFNFTSKSDDKVEWEAVNISDELKMEIKASIEFDGFVNYEVKIIPLNDIDLDDIRMEIPISKSASKYMMGLGRKGGYRPDSLDWKWDVATKNQDGAWIGDVNAGLQYSLRDENYIRPLNTNFYLKKPLLLPISWGNNGKGGISIIENNSAVFVNNYSGSRSLEEGEILYFNFNLLITPFHTIDTDFQWANKFYHRYSPVDTAKAMGATIINIHHANEINPYINYPFIAHEKMKAYVDEAHAKGMKVKIYNTVRELSNRAYELFPMRSLGNEIFTEGNGGGFSWLQEHIGDNYIAAWFVPHLKDAAIINSGMSRWHNYYVEGMNWLVQNVGIDGIYIDDVAFDRTTMKRIKRVLTKDNHPGIIDLHSANQYNERDGYINSAMLYMEHFPYINRLWFGEYFDYENNSPEFFLTEVSGIPFGLMGEMLEKGGNPWRGMIYGMTNRMPWTQNSDPRPLWKIWNDFGIAGSEMIGYWIGDSPVKTDHEKVLATVYKKDKSALIAVASWAENNEDVRLIIDWAKLGIDMNNATIRAPFVKDFQPQKTFLAGESIPVEKGKGWLLIIE
ncbi:glycoside hydrolase domain-containing protein [Bacteroidota bacterium]